MVHWTGGRTKEIQGWRKINRDSMRQKGGTIWEIGEEKEKKLKKKD